MNSTHFINSPINLIPSDPNWFDGKAIDELCRVSQFPGMLRAVAMPDMHSGMDTPNGAAFVSQGIIYPHLIGNDIGCGMALWQSDLKRNKLKLDRWTKKLTDLEKPWAGDTQTWLNSRKLDSTEHDSKLGTIGGGNHFAELQLIDKVFDKVAFENNGLSSGKLYLLVHSGSRSLGQAIMRAHVDRFRANGLATQSEEATSYLQQHYHAVLWAKANRALIANRFLEQLNSDCHLVLDAPHNCLTSLAEKGQTYWIHRKGTSPSDEGLIVIPGSRGALSYLVQPISSNIEHAWSLAHGAGRKWDRSETEKRIRHRFRKEMLVQTELGSRVICEDKSLLFQEAPHAYKNIEKVVGHLEAARLIKIVASLRPLITYKKRSLR